jgi:hypothetical protein
MSMTDDGEITPEEWEELFAERRKLTPGQLLRAQLELRALKKRFKKDVGLANPRRRRGR